MDESAFVTADNCSDNNPHVCISPTFSGKDGDFYESNLALLRANHPQAWLAITDTPIEPAGKTFIGPNGHLNLTIDNDKGQIIILHPENPEDEIRHFLKMVGEGSTGVVVFIGMGLGYSPMAILQQRPKIRHLALFEANPAIFLQALHHLDLSLLLSDPRLTLALGPDPNVSEILTPAARALQLEDTHLLQHPASFNTDYSIYAKLRDMLYEHINNLNVCGATTTKFGPSFLENRLRQLTLFNHSHLLEGLADTFANIPAIIVAGGPSLDKNIHILAQAKGKALIFAVDTVLPALTKHGISPDFVTSIDPQDLTYEKFADVVPSIKNISLITVPAITPRVTKNFPARGLFWIFNARPIEAWFNQLLGGTTLTAGAGTVAHLNILSAVILRCSPIIFVGQDLAFPTDRSHASHTVLTDKSEMKMAQQDHKNALWVDGINGGKVRTNRAYFSDKEYFERIISENKRHYINSTEGGVHIKGTEILTLSESIDRHCQKDLNIQERLDTFFCRHQQINQCHLLQGLRSVAEKVAEVRELIKQSNTISRKTFVEFNKLKKNSINFCSFAALPKKLQDRIIQIDRCHLQLDNEHFLWSILEEVTMKGLRQRERMSHEITELTKDPAKYLEWLELSMEMRDHINKIRDDILDLFEKNIRQALDHQDRESRLQKKLAMGAREDTIEILLELARLYFYSEDTVLATPILDKVLTLSPLCAEAHFGLGKIALHQTDYEAAERHFAIATQHDVSFQTEIDTLRAQFGEQYLAYGEKYFTIDSNTARRMFLKGLRYCPNYQPLKEKLRQLARKDIETICTTLSGPEHSETDMLSDDWIKAMQEEPLLLSLLDQEQVAEFYHQHARFLLERHEFQGAVAALLTVLEIVPDRPNIHISLADAFFTIQDFQGGLKHLQRAVALDNTYAGYWENMGDNLRTKGQLHDAILAYEQCFLALPHHLEMLQKIGDCYLSLGKPEAAREAYQQLKNRLESSTPKGQRHLH